MKTSTTPCLRRKSSSGFTLLETVVAMGVLLVVVGGVVLLAVQIERAFADQMVATRLSGTERRVVDRLTTEFRQAVPLSVLPPLLVNSPVVQFQKVDRVEDGVPILGPFLSFSFDAPSGELRFSEGLNAPIGIAANLMDLRFNSTASGIRFSGQIGVRDRNGDLLVRAFDAQATFRN